MANTFYAATNIKHGTRTEDGSQDGKYESKVFKAGDEVTGLSKEEMEELWHAGALTQTPPEQPDQHGEYDAPEEAAPTASASKEATSSTKATTGTNKSAASTNKQ